MVKVNPFVGGVGLGDVAGTEDDGGSSAHGDGGGVGEVIDSFGFAAFGGYHELPDGREFWIGCQWWARDAAALFRFHYFELSFG